MAPFPWYWISSKYEEVSVNHSEHQILQVVYIGEGVVRSLLVLLLFPSNFLLFARMNIVLVLSVGGYIYLMHMVSNTLVCFASNKYQN
jgi:hypothetical protein